MSEQQHKACTKCGEEKPLEGFYRNKRHRFGRDSRCKICASGYKKQFYLQNREHVQEINEKWRKGNPWKSRERNRRWKQQNPGKARESRSKSYWKHRDKRSEASRLYHIENQESVRDRKRKYYSSNAVVLRSIGRKQDSTWQELSSSMAVRRGSPWSGWEDRFILEENGMSLYQKAIETGRTYSACRNRQFKLRKELNDAA